MANTFTADFPEIWAREQQRIFYKVNVAMKIADMSFKADMKMGDTLNRPYRSSNEVQSYTPGTAITIDDKTDTQEALTVDKKYATGFYVDDFDAIQSNYDLIAKYAGDDAVYLSNQIDSDVLGEVSNATSTVDDGSIGGTAGNGITLATTNVVATVSAAKKALMQQNIPSMDMYGVVSPEFEDILVQQQASRATVMGDKFNENGMIGNFYGFRLHRSNLLTGSAVLSLVTQPTDADTVTIEGQVFTFVTSIGTTAGNVLIGSNVDASRVNLETLINAPGTTTANGVALTGANLRLFTNRVSAVDSPSGDTLTVTYKGVGIITVSDALTDATDEWTAATILQHQMFGATGNPVLVVQKEPGVQINKVDDKLGSNILNGVLYGTKTYTDNANAMVDVQIRADAF